MSKIGTIIDYTNTLKVAGITLPSKKQASRMSNTDRRIGHEWWLRNPGVAPGAFYVERWGDIYNEYAGKACIRPVIYIANPEVLKSKKDKFVYKGHVWNICKSIEKGYTVAFLDGPALDRDNTLLQVPFRESKIDWHEKTAVDPNGNPIEWADMNDYEKSTVKQVLEEWAKRIGIVNAPGQKPVRKNTTITPGWLYPNADLPKDGERVLITLQPEGKDAVVRSGSYSKGYFTTDAGRVWSASSSEIVAWAPSPVPAKRAKEA